MALKSTNRIHQRHGTVEEVLKGAFSGNELVIEMIGSADTLWFSEMPEYGVGEKHLLFLTTFDWPASTAGYRGYGTHRAVQNR